MLTKLKKMASDWSSGQKDRRKSGHTRSLTMCKDGYTFYYKNSWHFEKPDEVTNSESYTIPVHFTQCPAWLEQEVSSYDMESVAFA